MASEKISYYNAAVDNLKKYRATRARIYGETAIENYLKYRYLGGKRVISVLEQVKNKREARNPYKQASLFD